MSARAARNWRVVSRDGTPLWAGEDPRRAAAVAAGHVDALIRVEMTGEEVMARWRPGSHDQHPDGRPWTWADESADLTGRDAVRLAWVAAHYLDRPILVSEFDGRVWDGHHRVVAAARTGAWLTVVVLPAAGPAPAETPPAEAPSFMRPWCDRTTAAAVWARAAAGGSPDLLASDLGG